MRYPRRFAIRAGSQADLVQVDAALEGPGADDPERGRAGDLLQVPAVAEGLFADGQESLGELDALEEPAFVEGGLADVGERGREMDLLQEGVALFQGNLLAELAVFGHIVLEGEHLVAEDAAAFPDRHLRGIVLRVEDFLSVGGI